MKPKTFTKLLFFPVKKILNLEIFLLKVRYGTYVKLCSLASPNALQYMHTKKYINALFTEKSRIDEDNNDECIYAALAGRRLLVTWSAYAVFHYIFKVTQINQFLYDMNELQLYKENKLCRICPVGPYGLWQLLNR